MIFLFSYQRNQTYIFPFYMRSYEQAFHKDQLKITKIMKICYPTKQTKTAEIKSNETSLSSTHVATRKLRQVVMMTNKQVNTSQALQELHIYSSTLAHFSHCPFHATAYVGCGFSMGWVLGFVWDVGVGGKRNGTVVTRHCTQNGSTGIVNGIQRTTVHYATSTREAWYFLNRREDNMGNSLRV